MVIVYWLKPEGRKTMKPTKDHIIIKPIEEMQGERKIGRLVIPDPKDVYTKDFKREPMLTGEVIAVGPEVKEVKVGDFVHARVYEKFDIYTADGEIRIMREDMVFTTFTLEDYKGMYEFKEVESVNKPKIIKP